jgi:phage tail sheath protein FI
MPEYLSPGVYIEEVDTGNKPIEGVATSTVGFLGITERGPVVPTLITSFSEYVRTFGRYVETRYLTHGVEGFFQNGGKRSFVMRVVADDPATAPSSSDIDGMHVEAIGPGVWGNRVAVKVTNASLNDANLFKVTVMYWEVMPPEPLVDPTHPGNRTNVDRREPTLLEVYDNLTPEPRSSNFYERQINGFSNLIRVSQTAAGRPASNAPENDANPAAGQPPFLANGNDGAAAIDVDDFKGDPAAEPGTKRGLAALDEVDEIAILCCPDENDFPGIGAALVEQCERLKDRFAIVQAPQTAPTVATHRPPADIISKYSAYYYPWLRIRNPVTGTEMLVPPGGHVAGIYARSDIERGVHKAPANEVIRGLFFDPLDPKRSLQLQIAKGQQDILNPRGVNVLRYFPGRGNLVWGARTTTLDPDWKYVNVRRLFIFVEESIEEATQWVVFEPNDEPLWARVRRSVGDFLRRLWMDGMLQGKTAEEAYFVRCDRTTMTQADLDNGRLIILVGIAPVKPAEFVIFRIGQWTGGSEVAEG